MTNRIGQIWYCQYIRQGHFLVIGSKAVSNSNGVISNNSYVIRHDVFFLNDNEVFTLYEQHDGSWEKHDYNERII